MKNNFENFGKSIRKGALIAATAVASFGPSEKVMAQNINKPQIENNMQNKEVASDHSESAVAIEKVIKGGNYKKIIKYIEENRFEFTGSFRSPEIVVLKFLELYDSGNYKLVVLESNQPTKNLASESLNLKSFKYGETVSEIRISKETGDGYHYISFGLIKK